MKSYFLISSLVVNIACIPRSVYAVWGEDSVVLVPTNPDAADDHFGLVASMSGYKMAVGAYGDDTEGDNAGAVYTYTWSGTGWVADAVVLYPTNPTAAGDNFGMAVSMSADKMAIGASGDDSYVGAVYTYTWSGGAGAWVKDAAVLYPTNPVATNDNFGGSVSMSGYHMAIGAPGDDSLSGAVYT